MKEIRIAVEGITPLICNRFTDEAMEAATNGTRSSAIGNKGTPLEQAEKKLYIGHDGKPMIPQPNVFRSIIDGGTFHKAGKSKVTTLKTSMIPSCLAIDELEIPIIHREPWVVDTRAVRIPSTGGRISTHRPMFHDWRLEFTMQLDDSIMASRMLRMVIDDSGKRIGLGDFRPACKGPYGRYVVVEWRERDLAEAEAA